MKFISAVIFLTIIIFSYSCDSTEPPIIPPTAIVNNSIVITEVWKDLTAIKIKFTKSKTDTFSNFEYKLLTSTGKEIVYPKIIGEDTYYTYTGLSEGQSVSFKVEAFEATNLKDTSNALTLTTLSPTSHDITWKVDTLGQAGNVLRDIWGLDENNVWAVGYVDLPSGSSGIIKWDGITWLPFVASSGVKYGIYGFSETSIFVVGESANRGFIGHFDGTVWTEYNYKYFDAKGDTVYPLREIWGSSPDDVWAGGKNGTLIHWDGTDWEKVQSGIAGDITALFGTSHNEVYLAATTVNYSALYFYNGTNWNIESELPGIYAIALWKKPGGKLLAGGTGFFEYGDGIFKPIYIPGRTSGVIEIFGSDHNNIFTAGDFGEITHFDGRTWTDISQFEVPSGTYRVLRSVWCTEHKVFLAGVDQNRAIIIKGTLN